MSVSGNSAIRSGRDAPREIWALAWSLKTTQVKSSNLRGSESSPSCCVTSNAIDIRYEVSEMSTMLSTGPIRFRNSVMPTCYLVREDGVEDFALLFLVIFTHASMPSMAYHFSTDDRLLRYGKNVFAEEKAEI